MVIKKLGKLTTKEAITAAEKYIEIRNHKRNATRTTYSCWSMDNMFEISRALNERLNFLSDKDLKDMNKELACLIRSEQNQTTRDAMCFLQGLIGQIIKPQESAYGI